MANLTAALAALAVLLAAAACGGGAADTDGGGAASGEGGATSGEGGGGGGAAVSGTLTYRERIALPPGAVAVVQLLDVSLADAPAVLIAEQRIANPGSAPIAFRIGYDPARIDARRTYAVQASIRDGDRLLFANDTVYDVLTGGRPDRVDMALAPVAP